VSGHHDFTDAERARTPLSTSAACRSPFTNPILLVDPDVNLGRHERRVGALRGFSSARFAVW
jgi:hypothetical protein